MKLSDFDYKLPKQLIAHKPASPRDNSRLMVLDRQSKKIEHKHFFDIVDYLNKGDVLVLNNTKVFPARLIGQRYKTGGKVEVFLLKKVGSSSARWEVLIGNRRKKIGQIIEFGKGLECEIVKQIDESVWQVKFNKSGSQLEKVIDQIGEVPTPPYIKIKDKKTKRLKDLYQTVYAEHRGSVAAPTAGFHFTKPLINKLKKKGVQFEYVTLHVGFGTFEEVRVNNIKKHKMHSEFAKIDAKTTKNLNNAKKESRRVISVGTTSTRVLEAFSSKGKIKAQSKWVDIFIYPGYKFKFIDGLITNFHLPKSSLIMLVSALAGRQLILKAYKTAVSKKYRFYSFGDSMFIF